MKEEINAVVEGSSVPKLVSHLSSVSSKRIVFPPSRIFPSVGESVVIVPVTVTAGSPLRIAKLLGAGVTVKPLLAERSAGILAILTVSLVPI